jgi:hypothetical protein
MRRPHDAGWMAFALLLACSGCDPHAGAPPVESSMEEANVTGTVRVRGRPVNNVTVRFHAANYRRTGAIDREAPITKDGTYSIKAYIGENQVEVSCRELNDPKLFTYRDDTHPALVKSGENQTRLSDFYGSR